jgi:N-acetylneuraminic acid mutarotase
MKTDHAFIRHRSDVRIVVVCLVSTAACGSRTGLFAASVLDAGSSSSSGGTVVLFGENDLSGEPNVAPHDTWTFDGTHWTRVPVSNPPAARWQAAMATLEHMVVLFGGQGASNDTWTFDGTNWTQVPVSNAPPARYMASMATLGNKVVLFGGVTDDSPTAPFLSDTWTFDGTRWNQVSVSNPPPAHAGATMATLGNEVVLYGGSLGAPSDTWTFDGTGWTRVPVSNAPPARANAAMATLGNKVVLFGGSGGAGYLNDTWTFDGTSWIQVSVSKPPPARAYAAMATLGSEVVLFGGGNVESVNLSGDCWRFDGADWTQIYGSPNAQGAMATLP